VKGRFEETPPEFIEEMFTLFGELERGIEDHKVFQISEFVSPPLRRILTAAAVIPIGYVSTYGDIADVSKTAARAVGRAMATNPLYPVVPCHRVVGADFALIGYGGRRDSNALAAKLARLESEARDAPVRADIAVLGGKLAVYPVEQAIEAIRAAEIRREKRVKRKAEIEAADRRQLRLF
jgi:O-6-methylguanine DNA methyltransferase